MSEPKMQFCFGCGAALGAYRGNDGYDTCGARECNREVQDALAEERAAAHEQLDRDLGW